VHRVVVATVRRHEARHGLDNELAEPLRFPAVLAADLGPMAEGTHQSLVLRARAELAAYLSQIASDPVTPQLALWNLASLGFNRDHWGQAESYVAVVVIEGLARRFGIATRGSVIHDGQLDRSRLAALARPLALLSDDDLRAVARTCGRTSTTRRSWRSSTRRRGCNSHRDVVPDDQVVPSTTARRPSYSSSSSRRAPITQRPRRAHPREALTFASASRPM
jgi:hypothetical protein